VKSHMLQFAGWESSSHMAPEMLFLSVGGLMKNKGFFVLLFKSLNRLVKQSQERNSPFIIRPKASETIDTVDLIRLLRRRVQR